MRVPAKRSGSRIYYVEGIISYGLSGPGGVWLACARTYYELRTRYSCELSLT